MMSESLQNKCAPQNTTSTEVPASPSADEKSPSKVEVLQTVIVDFNDDFPHPNKWPNYRRWSIMTLLTLTTILANLSTTIVAPSLDIISAELNMDPRFEGPLVMSTYILAMALGPLLLAPFSELWGRVALIQGGNAIYLIFNPVCGFAKTRGQLVAFRLLAGFGSGVVPVVSQSASSPC